MREWACIARSHVEAGDALALVTQLAVEGSTPREAGTRMLVAAAREWGTIGGGALEQQVLDQARKLLSHPDAPRFAVQDYPLGPLLAQCCGGRVRLLIERLDGADRGWLAQAEQALLDDRSFIMRTTLGSPLGKSVGLCQRGGAAGIAINGAPASARGPKPGRGDVIVETSPPAPARLVMFGAGHVGRAVARAIEPLPFRLSWYDSRPDCARHLRLVVADRKSLIEAAAGPSDFTLVLTHDHALDYALVSAALGAGGEGYLGLIGSRTKRARFLSRLRAGGLSEAALSRLICPIGLSALRGKEPAVIAASVAADLLLRLQAREDARMRTPELASV